MQRTSTMFMPAATERRRGISGRYHGFTLIEMLVVIALVSILVAVIGISLQGGSRSAALINAQSMTRNLLSAARSKAVVSGQATRLLFIAQSQCTEPAADPGDPEVVTAFYDVESLRRILIVTEIYDGVWRITDEGVVLPRGVGFLPSEGSEVPTTPDVDWTNVEQSRFSSESPMVIEFGGVSRLGWYISYSARGTTRASVQQIVLSTVRESPSGPLFDNPDNLRGFTISSYGVPTLIDRADSFP